MSASVSDFTNCWEYHRRAQKEQRKQQKSIMVSQLKNPKVVITDSIVEQMDSGPLKWSTWYFCWFVLCWENYWILKDSLYPFDSIDGLNNTEQQAKKKKTALLWTLNFKCNVFLVICVIILTREHTHRFPADLNCANRLSNTGRFVVMTMMFCYTTKMAAADVEHSFETNWTSWCW